MDKRALVEPYFQFSFICLFVSNIKNYKKKIMCKITVIKIPTNFLVIMSSSLNFTDQTHSLILSQDIKGHPFIMTTTKC